MKVPFVDLTRTEKKVLQKINKKINSVIQESEFILGPDVDNFEKNFATYLGAKFVIAIASGTDGILLALKSLGVEQGDEVILPAFTFFATVAPILHLGAKPIFVDVLENKPLIDPKEIEKSITFKTKVIIVVHLHGFACNMQEILKIARKHNLFVIEDACQAHGSTYKGNKLGSMGDVGVFSFYPSKNLGAFGDAGALVVNNLKLAKKMRLFRNHGQINKYKHVVLGYNSRMDSIQAAVLDIKLSYLDAWNTERHKVVRDYKQLLTGLPIEFPKEEEMRTSNYHVLSVIIKRRNAVMKFLHKKGIQCGVHYPYPLHTQPALSFLKHKKKDFPHSLFFADNSLSLPLFHGITKKEILYVVSCMKDFFKK